MSKDKEPDFTNDEYWGKGGRYVVGPDGKRMPAPPVDEAAAADTLPAQTGQRPDNAAPGMQIDAQGLAPLAGTETAAEADPAKILKEKQRRA